MPGVTLDPSLSNNTHAYLSGQATTDAYANLPLA